MVNWWIDEEPYPGPYDHSDIIAWLEYGGKKYPVTKMMITPTYPQVLQTGDTMTFTSESLNFTIN